MGEEVEQFSKSIKNPQQNSRQAPKMSDWRDRGMKGRKMDVQHLWKRGTRGGITWKRVCVCVCERAHWFKTDRGRLRRGRVAEQKDDRKWRAGEGVKMEERETEGWWRKCWSAPHRPAGITKSASCITVMQRLCKLKHYTIIMWMVAVIF